ncbi:hypothetical protein EII35_14570 [Arachnia propionica]|uniref:Conjugal transfer protein TrbC n=2 Tax=Arachnia propionica TaxID=1750 RepID=A0A3P1WP11_9ACTN|nr:hypothetical protein EII35_14570 [Arachnia propionica]
MPELVTELLNLPMKVPDPGDGSTPPGFEKFTDVLGWVKWVSLGILVMALIIAGVRMAFGAGRGEGGEHASRIGWVLGGVMIVSGAVSIISFFV